MALLYVDKDSSLNNDKQLLIDIDNCASLPEVYKTIEKDYSLPSGFISVIECRKARTCASHIPVTGATYTIVVGFDAEENNKLNNTWEVA